MSITEKDLLLIESALLKRLSPDEVSLFEQRMKDHDFSAEYEARELMQSIIKEKGRAEFKTKLRSIDQQPEKPTRAYGKYFIPALILFVVAAMSILFILLFKNPAPVAPDTLYAEYYSPYPNTEDPITKGSQSNDAYSVYQLYELGEYRSVIENLEGKDKTTIEQWYLAQSYMAVQDYAKSTPILKNFELDENSEFQADASWYLALTLIKQGDIPQAQKILEKLSASDNTLISKRARELLDYK
jgi:tetratricopeptide (TPR) repeat protein